MVEDEISRKKAIINGSAEMKKSAKPKNKRTKLNHKTQKAVSTGSAILNNELNANLIDWVEYAIAWNTNKTESYRKQQRPGTHSNLRTTVLMCSELSGCGSFHLDQTCQENEELESHHRVYNNSKSKCRKDPAFNIHTKCYIEKSVNPVL